MVLRIHSYADHSKAGAKLWLAFEGLVVNLLYFHSLLERSGSCRWRGLGTVYETPNLAPHWHSISGKLATYWGAINFKFILFFMYCGGWGWQRSHSLCVWSQEDSVELVLSFYHHMGSEDWPQATRLGQQPPLLPEPPGWLTISFMTQSLYSTKMEHNNEKEENVENANQSSAGCW